MIPTPYYIVYEDRLRKNLELITDVARRAGVNIIMAFKANALWRTFPIIADYVRDSTASSPNELLLGRKYLGGHVHSYSPAYTDANIDTFLSGSSHLTFNSLSQWEHFAPKVQRWNDDPDHAHVSPGLRVNPECSVIDTDIYNPALPGGRFGVRAHELPELPAGIEGLHFHALCESGPDDLARVLDAFEAKFGHLLPHVKWVNMGGGHLMTRQGYDIDHLVEILTAFRRRWPHLEVILEPGSAFTWRTGDLVTSVVDIVNADGISTAILDCSFACHMPDTLEMPYQPIVSEAVAAELMTPGSPADRLPKAPNTYRLGGNSCLSGDFMGDWTFPTPLHIGDRLTLEDMNHYTTVKTNMFNGIDHPAILLQRADGSVETLRRFDFDDYRARMC